MTRILSIHFVIIFSILGWDSQAQDRVVTGIVSAAEETTTALPGVNVFVKGTWRGTITDSEGYFRLEVPADANVLVFTFIGYKPLEVAIDSRTVVDVLMTQDITELSEVVFTALNEKRETKTLTYSSQEIKIKQLNITQDANIKNAIAGKVAGVQLLGQPGAKLGAAGRIRIRGGISLTSDREPIYVVDGVPGVDPNDIDIENIATLNVLKGPNASALYGQRAEAGVIVITTKQGTQNLSVEMTSSTTFDHVAYLPKYQNEYGGGYDGNDAWGTFNFSQGADNGDGTYSPYPSQWAFANGKRYLVGDNNFADESWGPKFDGQEYIPWYAWWPGSSYYGKTARYVAQPDNIKDFYEVGKTLKNTFAVSGGNNLFNGRLSYTNLDQSGITPFTSLKKHFVTTNLNFELSNKLSIQSAFRFTTSKTRGDFSDGYGNQTTGAFNSWFNRNLDMKIVKQLKDLTTMDGFSTSWNWWGPDYYTAGGGNFRKPAFWFNPYTFMERFEGIETESNYTGTITPTYKLNDKFEITGTLSRTQSESRRDWKVPFFIANSGAADLYNPWLNSFGVSQLARYENNYSAAIRYKNRFGNDNFDVSALFGGNIRYERFDQLSSDMNPNGLTGGLIIPDLYNFANAGEVPTPVSFKSEKQVNSLYGNASLSYRQIAFLDLSYRKDWSSALPAHHNGYGYPGVGASLIFSEVANIPFLSFGKVRANWAQVGSDVAAMQINPVYPISVKALHGVVLQYSQGVLVDPNITPSLSTSFETGFDAKFLDNRIALNFTFYTENKNNEIIYVNIPSGSGAVSYLTNAGKVQRKGIEISLSGDILKLGNGFTWNALLNFSKYNSEVKTLPDGQEAITIGGQSDDNGNISLIHRQGAQWGQIRGRAIARDEHGNKIVDSSSGLYRIENDHDYGSIIPDFNGGFVNTFSYKGIQLQVAFDFQRGGKFFSASELWGTFTGLLEGTAATNDRGRNIRDNVSEGGGVHVVGVDENGNPFDDYVDAYDYSQQFKANAIPEPFIHNASYIKLRDISLSYDLTPLVSKTNIFKGATIGIVARNLARFGLSKDNVHRWDPSEMSNVWGENANLPGTRSYGVNIKMIF